MTDRGPSDALSALDDIPIVVEHEELAPKQLEALQNFGTAFARATRSFNMYARNNATLLKHLDDAQRYVEQVVEAVGNLELSVRRDTLSFRGQELLQDADRENGIPFRLFRAGVRRLTIEAGIEKDSLCKLIEILSRSPTSGDLDDDLVSSLWREDLPHVRYVTLDVYAVSGAGSESEEEDKEQEALRQDLDKLLSAIYQNMSGDAEGVKTVNVSSDDLVALATLGEGREQDSARIGTPTARAIFNLPEEMVQALQNEVESELDERLLDTTFEVMLGALFRANSMEEAKPVVDEILNLYDSMLLRRDFTAITRMVQRLVGYTDGNPARTRAIIDLVLNLLNAEERLTQITVALNDGAVTGPDQLRGLLTALGPAATPVLLNLLPTIQQPQHRRLLCDLVLETAPPSVELLRKLMGSSEWFVDRDILYLAAKIADPLAAHIIIEGCRHPHARVRQQAVGMLQHAPPGGADQLLCNALTDADSGVRVTAVRTLTSRKTSGAASLLYELVMKPEFEQREPGEQRTFLVAFAALAGAEAVPVLDHLLNGEPVKGNLLERLKRTVEAVGDPLTELHCAAAVALSSIGSAAALQALDKGAGSRDKAVRDVCMRSLRKLQP